MNDQAFKLREYYRTSSDDNKPKIISVTSGKGGTGKTFFSFYLSQILAAQGFKTLLVEFDFNLGSLAYHLDQSVENTLGDFFLGSIFIDELPVKINENFSIIFGDNGKLNFPENLNSQIENFLRKLNNTSKEYDFILLDNGAGIGSHIFETLKHSSMNLIVSLPDPVAIMDAYVVIKLMTKNSLTQQKGIILNKCNSPEEGKTAFENLNRASQHFFKKRLNLVGIFPDDRDFQELKLLDNVDSKIDNSTSLISELNRAATRITTIEQMANNHQLKI